MNSSYFSSLKKMARTFVRRRCEWSIGIYTGESLFDFSSTENIKNPVLTAKDVTDVTADFVADPFMVRHNDIWYMFFEVLNSFNDRGEIGLATSNDGFNWDYKQIVIKEPFHLSYPYVFKFQNEYYIIPESYEANSIRLYKAVDFPTQWTFVKTLIDGRDYVDSSIFNFNDRWWIFTSSSQSNILRLYYTDDLMGHWIEHPQSPIIEDNLNIARPGGRVVVYDGQIFRYTQDDEDLYGSQVRAFEITHLTTTTYEEKQVRENPILKASKFGWNKTGMHNIDPHQITKDKWIACVDGYQIVFVLGVDLQKLISL
ncbi:glucosamine inositolphosphorylceramide transferase family protein [Komarekiella delphini-convector]|uniref:glucosamine inositolphosphorylceramide transferase family protein n=1 Tax=Komarekiella delphini-convector TaxID=3050158 RepID=UPI0032AFD7D0